MGYILSAISIIAGVIAIVYGRMTNSKENKVDANCTASINGTILDMKRNLSKAIETGYYPTVKFKVNNRTYKASSTKGFSKDAFKENQSVKVYYNPQDPTQFCLVEKKNSTIISAAYGIGAILVFLGIVLLIVTQVA